MMVHWNSFRGTIHFRYRFAKQKPYPICNKNQRQATYNKVLQFFFFIGFWQHNVLTRKGIEKTETNEHCILKLKQQESRKQNFCGKFH